MKRVMIDIETLGIEPGAAILSIGAVEFGTEGPTDDLYLSVGLQHCEAAGLTIDAETLQWWLGQDGETNAIDLITQGMPLERALERLAEFCEDADEVWANSPKFDCAHLEAAYEAVGIDVPWDFYQLRDVRTVKELPGAPDIEQDGVEHNALDDAIYQAKTVAATLRALEDGTAENNPSNIGE